LGGTWEPPDQSKQLNPAVGRRLVPGNMGFALVQSETADIFAMRLAHNNALVSFRMQPNPDIPKDWNLIPFPMNNRYVKQGTLDGKVGYDEKGSIVLDPDYEGCSSYGEHSYYKPSEAYALKRQIQREEAQLVSYYEDMSIDAGSQAKNVVGRAGKMASEVLAGAGASSNVTDTLGNLYDTDNPGDKGLPKKYAKRNMCNTYVWTADGGFFAETTETSDVRTESTSGDFSFNGSIGGNFSTDVSVFGLGFGLEFDASIGGGLSSTSAKDKESEKSFSIDATVDPPGDLQIYRDDGTGKLERIYDDDGNGVNAAGKVDAYRFMSFYLDTDKNHFEDLFNKVIDPTWLRENDHPNAIALRQANQAGRKPACWRIMHRVTFVSRLLPDFSDPSATPTLEHTMKDLNIGSNWQLIKKLEPLVRNKTGDDVAFSKAVRDSIAKYMPELKPHTKEITQYLRLYFGMEE
jgi:hypothetical protein